MSELNRRSLIKNSLLTVASMASARAMGTCLGLTPQQTEGPFYPERDQRDKNNDLTRVKGRHQEALGQRILLHGRVLDENCQPVPNALIEIWQACESGRYNHSQDPNLSAPLDPNFQYWGQDTTDADGAYSFITIRPGQYPATQGWIRPAHIHLKVQKRGYHELTSQIYFADDELNSRDAILMSLSPEDRSKVIIDFVPPEGSNTPVGQFDAVIESVF